MTIPAHLLSNPLVNPPQLPHGAPPFDRVTNDHFLPAIEYGIAKTETEIEAIKNNPAMPDFANTVEALEFSGAELGRIRNIYGVFTSSRSSPQLRALEGPIAEKLTAFHSNLGLDDVLFARIDAVYNAKALLGLDPVQTRLLEKMHRNFVRSGALLGPADKQRFRDINEKLAELGVQFSRNKMEATGAFSRLVDDESELDGLPQDIRDVYKSNAVQKGMPDKWVIGLEPHPAEIMTHASNRDLRRDIQTALRKIGSEAGPHDNRPVILEIVQLRHEAAQLLGFATHAEFVLSERMAGSQKAVENFLQRNLQAYKPAAESYLNQVRDLALATDGIADLKPWDIGYYGRILEEQTFNINMEEVRSYFDIDRAFEGLRQHTRKLFGVDFRDAGTAYPVYSPDVKTYEAVEESSGRTIGLFYANYYATPNVKRGGAWMGLLRERAFYNGQSEIPQVTNDCNFQRPVDGKPVAPSLDGIITMAHEGGHRDHGLLTAEDCKYPSLSGTNVKWDWVELPSQLQENWVLQKEFLNTVTAHPVTGDPMPDDMISKLQDKKNFDAGFAGLRQTFLGLLDMKWHSTDPKTIASVEELEDSVVAVASLMPRGDGTVSGGFSHIFAGGYDAGYYSYKWAEVLEADVFDPFLKRGLYDQAWAQAVKTHIYATGGLRDPAESFRALRGRDPDPDILFRREGILPGAAASAPPGPVPGTAPKP